MATQTMHNFQSIYKVKELKTIMQLFQLMLIETMYNCACFIPIQISKFEIHIVSIIPHSKASEITYNNNNILLLLQVQKSPGRALAEIY